MARTLISITRTSEAPASAAGYRTFAYNGGVRLALAGVLVMLLAPAATAQATAPPPALSRDHSPADVASTYGSGAFGGWQVDAFGMPRFRYDVDEAKDPRAPRPRLAGGALAPPPLGHGPLPPN